MWIESDELQNVQERVRLSETGEQREIRLVLCGES